MMKKIKLLLILLLLLLAVHNSRATSEEVKEHGAEGIAQSAEGEGGHGEIQEAGHEPAAAGHEPSAHGEEHGGETPLAYYMIWVGLAIIGMVVLNAIRALKKEKREETARHDGREAKDEKEHGTETVIHGESAGHESHAAGHEQHVEHHEVAGHGEEHGVHDEGHKKHKSNLVPLILVVVSFAIFFSEQLPALFGRVDIGQAKLVYGFHEDLFLGFIKLFVKIILGVLLVSYSILGMEEHH